MKREDFEKAKEILKELEDIQRISNCLNNFSYINIGVSDSLTSTYSLGKEKNIELKNALLPILKKQAAELEKELEAL